MKKDRIARRTVISGLCAIGLTGVCAGKSKSLFNGRDLTGWKHYANGIWEVRDGTILCRYDNAKIGPGYLFTEQEFSDFDLRLEFWVSKRGNSGVFIRQRHRDIGPRGTARPAHSPGDGVEVQIDYNDPKNLTGSIYNLQKPSRLAGGEERWNRYRIRCVGERVQVWVEDELVNDYSPIAAKRGAIGFQMHGGKPHDHIVRFRNVEIEEL